MKHPICWWGEPEKLGGWLAAGGYKTSFVDFRAWTRVSQTGRVEVWPDLWWAIQGRRSNRKPVSLGQHRSLTGFHFGGEEWQRYHRRSEDEEYRQGWKRFDHLWAADFFISIPLALGDRSNNNHNEK
jgi:hypothetical protein